jgi:hypothetical protein
MLIWRFAAVACLAVGCRDASDPGFEIVRVPQSAYAAPDAATKNASPLATADAGPDPVVLCVSHQDSDDEQQSECPDEYQGRHYDEKTTTRHRSRGDDATVCCYRKGRVPRSTHDED